MPTRATHTIRRQHLHVALHGSEQEGFALQNRLAALCADWLPAALEQSLDHCAPAEGILSIEHLEVDAGEVSLDRLEQDVVAQIVRAVELALLEKTYTAGSQSDQSAAPSSAEARLKSEAQAVWEAFVHFLEFGRFPWSFRLAAGETLEGKIQQLWLEEKRGTTVFQAKLGDLKQKLRISRVRQRLVGQFSEAFGSEWLRQISPVVLEDTRAALRLLREVQPSMELAFFEKRLWETALSVAANGASSGAAYAGDDSSGLVAPLSFTALPSETARRLLSEALREAQREALSKVAAWHQKLLREAQPSPAAQALLALLPAAERDSAPTASKPSAAESYLPLSPDETEGIYVENAGAVLLHPFLPQFFAALKIAENDTLAQPERALQLLHYLCTGQPEAPEYELSFPKILCGLPLEQPIETSGPLTENELAEADNLLQTVVRYWDALKNTSTDGLREAFLRRAAKLSRRPDGEWLLHMERKAIDILLDQLPWGIGMIQLPWMPQMLHVEWAD